MKRPCRAATSGLGGVATIPIAMIRPATINDVPAIADVINSHAERGLMLFKSYAQLYENVRDFAVYEDPLSGKVLGCVALAIIWADLAEVRSLAVEEGHRGRGIGSELIRWTLDEARRLQIRKLMTLTYQKRFFEKLGFDVVEKETLPLKVWRDCVHCSKQANCDEIAMVRVMTEVPVCTAAAAPPTPRGISIPVLSGAIE